MRVFTGDTNKKIKVTHVWQNQRFQWNSLLSKFHPLALLELFDFSLWFHWSFVSCHKLWVHSGLSKSPFFILFHPSLLKEATKTDPNERNIQKYTHLNSFKKILFKFSFARERKYFFRFSKRKQTNKQKLFNFN